MTNHSLHCPKFIVVASSSSGSTMTDLVFEYNSYKISYEKDHKWLLDKELEGDK
jgi:hypothetical protein